MRVPHSTKGAAKRDGTDAGRTCAGGVMSSVFVLVVMVLVLGSVVRASPVLAATAPGCDAIACGKYALVQRTHRSVQLTKLARLHCTDTVDSASRASAWAESGQIEARHAGVLERRSDSVSSTRRHINYDESQLVTRASRAAQHLIARSPADVNPAFAPPSNMAHWPAVPSPNAPPASPAGGPNRCADPAHQSSGPHQPASLPEQAATDPAKDFRLFLSAQF